MWEKIINDFVIKRKRERFFFLAEHPNRESQLRHELLHAPETFKDDCILKIRPRDQNSSFVIDKLKKLGASKECWAYSIFDEIDSKYVDYRMAVRLVFGQCKETILYFENSSLGYYEGGHCDRLILKRTN